MRWDAVETDGLVNPASCSQGIQRYRLVLCGVAVLAAELAEHSLLFLFLEGLQVLIADLVASFPRDRRRSQAPSAKFLPPGLFILNTPASSVAGLDANAPTGSGHRAEVGSSVGRPQQWRARSGRSVARTRCGLCDKRLALSRDLIDPTFTEGKLL